MSSRLIPFIALAAVAAAGCASGGARESSAATRASAAAPTAATRAPGRAATRASTAHVSHPFLAPIPKPTARLWAVGDSAGGAEASGVERLIARGGLDRLLYLGDVYPVGNRAGFRAYARVYGTLAKRTAPTPGNHDWPYRATGYDRYWHDPPEWYSFTAAGWRVIELNSETARRAAQLRWLRALVRARPGDCRLAFWHKPRFSAGVHGDNRSMDPYWRVLAGHARLVVSGHDHDMQRFASRAGLVQLVSGAGGRSHYRVDRQRRGLAFADDTHDGALRIDLARGSARIAFISTSGTVLDARTVACTP